MAGIYDEIDIRWNWRGDYLLGDNGDLAASDQDRILALVDSVMILVQSAANDWQEQPSFAASLEDFVGEPNNRETGNSLKGRVIAALTSNRVVRKSDLAVNVMPVDVHSVLIMITIDAIATAGNSLQKNQMLQINLLYNTTEQGIMPINYILTGAFD